MLTYKLDYKMQIKMSHSFLYGFTFIGSVLSHALSNALPDSTRDTFKRQSLLCNNHCPYGFVPDVEGQLTCDCFNPCSAIMCLRGSVCVAEMPSSCDWDLSPCKPVTRCQVEPMKIQVSAIPKQWKDMFLHDEPVNWSKFKFETDASNVCSLPLSETAVLCKRKRRRWYYNVNTGKCQKFMGCDTIGNNFSRKRSCKNKCRRHIVHPAELRTIMNSDLNCESLPDFGLKCIKFTRRWYYNDQTGKCQKFLGCQEQGKNNYSRKVFCKKKCHSKIREYRTEQKRQRSLSGLDHREQEPR